MELEDTIVAISSPPGAAMRGIVRLSGQRAVHLAEAVFKCADDSRLSEQSSSTHQEGSLQVSGHRLPAFASIFRSPRSYTRQDMVEIHLLGAPTILGMVVEMLIAAGARRAEPGEFTARAFLAGALDASQVHGVAGLIAAKSDQQLRAAEQLLHGTLSQTANDAREELADLLSLVEGAMDFADEPIEFITPNQLRERLTVVRDKLQTTVAAGQRTQRWARLPQVVLIGSPNAGKSSLFNRLTGMDRAICTPIAGTTRDAISAPLAINESECLLIDTAGIEATADELRARSQSVTLRQARHADLLLHVVDMTAPPETAPESNAGVTTILVANKCDLVQPSERLGTLDAMATHYEIAPVAVSAATGEGCVELTRRIAASLIHSDTEGRDDGIAMMAEHRDALIDALETIERAIKLATDGGSQLENADVVALELHTAADSLAMLVGRDDTEALLGRIFSRFCVGK
ncbi:MAG: tRNA modification GTPase [Planctomycetota bacterium]